MMAASPIIIMTSNIGSNWIQEEKDEGEIKKRVQEALRAHFRPEFLNRIDEIVIFKRLTDEQLSRIVDIQLAQVSRRLEEKRIRLELTEAAKAAVAKEGYDPGFGARPLKRALQQLIFDPLSKKVIAGEIHEGVTVKVDAPKKGGHDLVFSTNSR
jgi:ATP-dependent Clp protease ATP-binding subunit ClpB